MARAGGRATDQLRPVTIEPGALRYPEGSALISMGETRVLCSATVEVGVPRWLRGSGSGWVTAEYGMLPRSTHTRSEREARTGRQSGRSQEIQRLIGRSLRAVLDLDALGEQSITVDCDVIQADGGTRTAAITGGWVALQLAIFSTGCSAAARSRRTRCARRSPRSRSVWPAATRCSISTTTKTRARRPTSTSCSSARASSSRCRAPPSARRSRGRDLDAVLSVAEQGISQLLEAQREAVAAWRSSQR